jgi:branched-chain amino acid transport system permease protein
VIGAISFHIVKETTWTYLLDWQYIVLGIVLIVNIVFFQQGIMGWLKTMYPEKFGIVVDKSRTVAKGDA